MELLNSASTSLRAVSGRLGLSSSAPTGIRKLCRQAGGRNVDPKTTHTSGDTGINNTETKQLWFPIRYQEHGAPLTDRLVPPIPPESAPEHASAYEGLWAVWNYFFGRHLPSYRVTFHHHVRVLCVFSRAAILLNKKVKQSPAEGFVAPHWNDPAIPPDATFGASAPTGLGSPSM